MGRLVEASKIGNFEQIIVIRENILIEMFVRNNVFSSGNAYY